MIFYGLFLILAGTAGYLSNPEKAKTALMSGGTFGGLSALLGWLGLRGAGWWPLAARVLTGMLSGVFVWRSVVTWGKVFDGAPEKTFAAVLITLMLAASAAMYVVLLKETDTVRGDRDARQ